MPDAPFFVAGGTVPPGSASYVERAADRELLDALLAGEFCYVLNSRQMGKSSLAVRTIARLKEAGVRTAFVDLTKVGSANLTADQWYAGLLVELGRALGQRAEAVAALRENPELGPAQRLFAFLQDRATDQPTVVMIDEIDATRSLSFSTDEFFAGVRQCWNARASEPRMARLAFCLLGAALPSDLIRDPRVTPFNVGRRVELRDLSPEEARPFGAVVGEAALARVLHWTGGHPFLTQALCAGLGGATPPGSDAGTALPGVFDPRLSSGTPSGSGLGGADAGPEDASPPGPLSKTSHLERGSREVDALVRSRYLDARARDADSNLADVGNRLLGTGDPGVTEADRADALSLYARMLKEGIADDEANPAAARIKMSGVARTEDGRLRVRNRIYAEAFGRAWVRENMPGGELRRQRKAFWRGAVRTALAAAAVVGLVGWLAWNNARLARVAREGERRASYEAYVSSMNLLPSVWREANREKIMTILDRNRHNPNRGWEWEFWNARVGGGRRVTDAYYVAISPDGRTLASRVGEWVSLFDSESLRLRKRYRVPGSDSSIQWVRGGLLTVTGAGEALLIEPESGRVRRRYPLRFLGYSPRSVSPDGRTAAAIDPQGRPVLLDVASGRTRVAPLGMPPNLGNGFAGFSPDGRTVYWTSFKDGYGRLVAIDVAGWRRRAVFRLTKDEGPASVVVSPDGRRIVVGTFGGRILLLDAATGRIVSATAVASVNIMRTVFSADGARFVTTTSNRRGAVFAVDAKGLRRLAPLRGFNGALFLPHSHRFVASYEAMQILDADRMGEDRFPRLRSGLYGLAIAWRGDRLLALENVGGRLRASALDTVRGGGWRPLGPTPDDTWIDPDTGLAYVVRPDGRSAIRDLERGTDVLPLPPTRFREGAFVADPGRRFAAVRPSPVRLEFWDLRRRRRVGERERGGTLTAWRFSPAGDRLALGFADGTTELLDTATWRPVWSGIKSLEGANDFDFSPDGRRLAAATGEDNGVVMDLRTGRVLRKLVGHGQGVTFCRYSPDGRRIVTASGDLTVRLWDAETGRETTVLDDEGLMTSSLRYSPDGRRIWSTTTDGRVRVWTTEAGG